MKIAVKPAMVSPGERRPGITSPALQDYWRFGSTALTADHRRLYIEDITHKLDWMETILTGKAYVLGDNIDTDQIIPASYLSFNPSIPEERKYFGMYAMSSVPEGQRGLPSGDIPFVRKDEFKSDFQIVIGGKNFGCGSSREHAPLALAEAGIKCVIAEFYARIFFRNSVNGGYLPPLESVDRLVEKISTGDELEVRLMENIVINKTKNQTHALQPIGDVLPIIEAGDVFKYARQMGMVK